ncbi:hypothetical protein HYU92_02610 [Candidatus Curtissbacteria bacterium]|nr:hypothetical protein [Candidatus Curtissbacteria bacterium]
MEATKKCKDCQSEIDAKAKKCPHCQTDLRSWPARHPILALILAFVVIPPVVGLFVTGSSSQKKDTATSSTTQQPKSEVQQELPKPTPMKIAVRDLADDFDANQVAAEVKWKDKFVEFSATISNITESGISFHNVATKDFSLTQISCRVEDKTQLLPLKNGQTVTVRGVVGTQTIGVIEVRQCEIAS